MGVMTDQQKAARMERAAAAGRIVRDYGPGLVVHVASLWQAAHAMILADSQFQKRAGDKSARSSELDDLRSVSSSARREYELAATRISQEGMSDLLDIVSQVDPVLVPTLYAVEDVEMAYEMTFDDWVDLVERTNRAVSKAWMLTEQKYSALYRLR